MNGGKFFAAFSVSEVRAQQQQKQQECPELPLDVNACSKVDTCYRAEDQVKKKN